MSSDTKTTPYYCIDLRKVKANYISFYNAINSLDRNDIIAYSVKANYHPAIISLLDSLGAFFEICSEHEYNLLCNYGIDTSRIIVNGCFYRDCSKFNDSIIILDSLNQFSNWINQGCHEQIGFRVNLNFFTKDDRFQNQKSRFGIDINSIDFKKALGRANTDKIICLHCHLSGNTRNPSIYNDIIQQLLNIQQSFGLSKIKYFDIGGGFKIDNDAGLWDYSDYINALNISKLKDIQLIFEPGNCLVRDCAEYHSKIIDIKTYEKNSYFIADGSSLHIPKYNKNTSVVIKKNYHSRQKLFGKEIYGNTCKESDLLYKFKCSTGIGIGDEIIIKDIGAYSINEINPLILGYPDIYIVDSLEDGLE